MGTVPNPPAKADDEAAYDAAVRAERIEAVKGAVLTLVSGGEGQPWRRPALFITVAATLAFAGPIGAIGLAALVALVYTDRVYTQEDPTDG